jgi:hypothetical protein
MAPEKSEEVEDCPSFTDHEVFSGAIESVKRFV